MDFQRNTNTSSYKKVSILQQTLPSYEHVYKIMMIVDSKEAKQKKTVQQLCILEIYQEIKVQTSQREIVLSADILAISPSSVVKEVQLFVLSARKEVTYQKHAEVQVNPQQNPILFHHIPNV